MKKRIFISLAALLGGLLALIFLFANRPYRPPRLLETSAPGTAALAREFYACGPDCPYYRVLSAGGENSQYAGRMADLRGFDVWGDLDHEAENAEELFMAKAVTDKFVCQGRFELYERGNSWECCMDSDNLVFQADECRQVPRTMEERCLHNRWIFETANHRSLEALPQAAGAGEAEAQYLLADVYEQGIPCFPRNMALALYWYGRAAAQGHKFAIESLESIGRREKPASN